jgi:hypothetical protein
MASVVIRDNGCGIAEDKLAKIFNPFYTTKKNGTGLGMGIAKKVMDAHNGRIEVQSKPAIGTEFRLSISLADAVRAQNQGGQTGQPEQPDQSERADQNGLNNSGPTDTDPVPANHGPHNAGAGERR